MKSPEKVEAFFAEQDAKRVAAVAEMKAKAAENARRDAEAQAAKYERDGLVVDGALADVFGCSPHPEITEEDRAACVAWLADRFREQIASARMRRDHLATLAPRSPTREVDATQPIEGGLVVELDGKRDTQEVRIDGTTYVLGRGRNWIPADATDISELEKLVGFGVATIRAPGGA
jgi:hypothetical protein